ncbi:hypothetical protein FLL89_12690, partial [Vibrio cholerae]
WLSVNFDVFIKNLLRLWYEKILLLTSVNLWGDYPSNSGGAHANVCRILQSKCTAVFLFHCRSRFHFPT